MRVTKARWPFRLPSLCLLLFLFVGLFFLPSQAELLGQMNSSSPQVRPSPTRARRPAKTGAAARNPQISKIVAEIDPRNIENTIRKLVSFGTRLTLSAQDPSSIALARMAHTINANAIILNNLMFTHLDYAVIGYRT